MGQSHGTNFLVSSATSLRNYCLWLFLTKRWWMTWSGEWLQHLTKIDMKIPQKCPEERLVILLLGWFCNNKHTWLLPKNGNGSKVSNGRPWLMEWSTRLFDGQKVGTRNPSHRWYCRAWVALIQEYNRLVTHDEDQLQFLMQIATEHRRAFPDSKKSTLLTWRQWVPLSS